ncbi:MAG: hypothetical protein AAF671_10175 [Pseudomonadota bacterium]
MITRGWLALGLIAVAISAQAHFPTLDCGAYDEGGNKQLRCVAGFSDGSSTGEVELQVFTYEEELIEVVMTNAKGEAVLAMPEGEFFIVFDANHESPAEFDYAELE